MEIDEIIRDIFGPDVFLESNDTKFSKENEKPSRYFYQSYFFINELK